MTDLALTNNILQMVAVGLGIFVFAIVSMTVLFGMATKDVLKHKKGIVGMLILAILMPVGVMSVRQMVDDRHLSAKTAVKLNYLEMVPGDSENWIISFETDKPAIGYLEVLGDDGNTIPVLPTYKIEVRDDHYFLIDGKLFDSGKVFAVIDGNRIAIKK